MIPSEAPFRTRIHPRWIPQEMKTAPTLTAADYAGPIEPHYALLLNPFYPKDAHASFGKHVLTPTLALSSFAATTPGARRLSPMKRKNRCGATRIASA